MRNVLRYYVLLYRTTFSDHKWRDGFAGALGRRWWARPSGSSASARLQLRSRETTATDDEDDTAAIRGTRASNDSAPTAPTMAIRYDGSGGDLWHWVSGIEICVLRTRTSAALDLPKLNGFRIPGDAWLHRGGGHWTKTRPNKRASDTRQSARHVMRTRRGDQWPATLYIRTNSPSRTLPCLFIVSHVHRIIFFKFFLNYLKFSNCLHIININFSSLFSLFYEHNIIN